MHAAQKRRTELKKPNRRSVIERQINAFGTPSIYTFEQTLNTELDSRIYKTDTHPLAFRLPAVADRTDVARDSCL